MNCVRPRLLHVVSPVHLVGNNSQLRDVGVPTVKLGLPRAPVKLGFPHVAWAYELCISKVRLWDVLVWEAVFLKADHFSWLLGTAARFY